MSTLERHAFAWETTVGAERIGNLHAREGVTETEFVELRQVRDATLPMPKLILLSVQVNICASRLQNDFQERTPNRQVMGEKAQCI